MALNKYNAVPCWMNVSTMEKWQGLMPPNFTADGNPIKWTRFASKLERDVYEEIRMIFRQEWVVLQPKLTLKAKSRYSSSIIYQTDFLVCHPSQSTKQLCSKIESDNDLVGAYRFIEAKGVLTPAAKLKLQLMEVVLPHQRDRLVIVSREKEFYFGSNMPASDNLTSLSKVLKQLKKTILIQQNCNRIKKG